MNTYKRHRFPPAIISYAVRRYWCIKFGAKSANRLKRRHQGYGDTFYVDEVFVKIGGKQRDLWRAMDQDGDVVDVYLQARRDGVSAKRFFKRLLRSHGGEPRKIVSDKLLPITELSNRTSQPGSGVANLAEPFFSLYGVCFSYT
jgi:putative transposase